VIKTRKKCRILTHDPLLRCSILLERPRHTGVSQASSPLDPNSPRTAPPGSSGSSRPHASSSPAPASRLSRAASLLQTWSRNRNAKPITRTPGGRDGGVEPQIARAKQQERCACADATLRGERDLVHHKKPLLVTFDARLRSQAPTLLCEKVSVVLTKSTPPCPESGPKKVAELVWRA